MAKRLFSLALASSRLRNLHTRTLLILAFIILVCGFTLISNIDLLSARFELNTDRHPVVNIEQDDSKLPPLASKLDPNGRYISYLPFAGLTNQFIGLQNAAFIALKLNRTLILPPIVSNTHDHDNTHQRWSRYLDLPRFTELTGVQVLEWDSVKPLAPEHHRVGRIEAQILDNPSLANQDQELKVAREAWHRIAENVTAQIVYGYGSPDLNINMSARYFAWHFFLKMNYVQPPPAKAGVLPPEYDPKKVAPDAHKVDDLVTMEDLLARYGDGEPASQHLLFLTHTFKIKDPYHKQDRYWPEIGQHFHFLPKLMDYATNMINKELAQDPERELVPNDDAEQIEESKSHQQWEHGHEHGDGPDWTTTIPTPEMRTPYIAIHLRRGDIIAKCGPDRDPKRCMIPFSHYAYAVERARTAAAAHHQQHIPVVVTTDTKDEEDFRQIKALGWHYIDHTKAETARILGPFGPAMTDAAILAHADEFVGSGMSTMTKIAARRQDSWYHRASLYPTAPPPPPPATQQIRRRRW